ncbi:MAG: putative metal-binding motif-containing protein [Myxococcota bacterium]
MSRPRPRRLWYALAALSLLVACGGGEAGVETLHLEISSDAPAGGQQLQEVRLLFIQQDEDGKFVRYPASLGDSEFERPVVAGEFDPVAAPVLIKIQYGAATFAASSAPVRVQVTGRAGGRVATSYEGVVDLTQATTIKVHLAVLNPVCDVDNDGFVDCGVEGCCDGPSPLADCEPNVATANPWAREDPCADCNDGIDQDCQGDDAKCEDADNDGVFDCLELDAKCGLGDPNVGPGLPELCDGRDNDCDSSTDEGFAYQVGGVNLPPGAACGVGECAGGTVECEANGLSVVCSSAGKVTTEVCGDGKDNDCDGATDEECTSADLDGDGFTKEQGDCNDFDSGRFPGAPEKCCPAVLKDTPTAVTQCDKDCSGDVKEAQFCAVNDLDGDGYSPPNDCDDNDPFVYPGAPEKCGDGVDQDCFADDLPCEGVEDADGDHWSPPADCNDEDPGTNPAAAELCDRIDNNCNGLTDEGNPGTDGSGACGSDVGQCKLGTRVCVAVAGPTYEPGDVVCIGDTVPADERCNGLDDDCDGKTDEEFTWAGLPVDASCDGVGECGQGIVECLPDEMGATCSSNADGSAPEVAVESCDGEDDDCDGTTDEALTDYAASTCLTAGVCGTKAGGAFVAKAVCRVDPKGATLPGWDCDYTTVSTFEADTETSCDGLDNDCDGGTDDEFKIGAGCDGDDADECKNGVLVCDGADPTHAICDESNSANVKESCDGADNDCDGQTDEDFKPGLAATDPTLAYDGGAYAADAGLYLSESCGTGLCAGGTVVCDPQDPKRLTCTSAGAAKLETCDGVDQDCNGATDNGFDVGADCGIGACVGGKKECVPGGAGTKCDSMPAGATQLLTGSKSKSSAEICDNIDNDCDAQTDEQLTADKPAGLLAAGCNPAGVCGEAGQTSALCTAGVWTCTYSSVNYSKDGELDWCDALDNNCDGSTDEDYGQDGTVTYLEPDGNTERVLADGCGFGKCAGGVTTCAPSKDALMCTTAANASVETCNNVDDDCDGTTDEQLTSIVDAACDTDGACGQAGKTTALCTAGTWACTYSSADYQKAGELGRCDAIDNDCDAKTDEDFGASGTVKFTEPDGVTKRVLGASCGLGKCAGGTTVCAEGGATLRCTSVAASLPADTCTGLDDDCDGETDEQFKTGGTVSYGGGAFGGDSGKTLGEACGTGKCAGGKVVCATTSTLTCDKASAAVTETCNGVDDDCDGKTDEDFKAGGSVSYGGGPLAGDAGKTLGQACGAGSCAGGLVICDPANATKLTCSTLSSAGDDVCDNLDNDCDGASDEGFGAGGTVSLSAALFAGDVGKVKGAACGTGTCLGGTVGCKVGDTMALACSSEGGAGEELCDAVDNDCDGSTDEVYAAGGTVKYGGGPFAADAGKAKGASCGTGVCAAGTVVCDAADPTKKSLTCSKLNLAGAEKCDLKDNDCDGTTDEDYKLGGTKPWVEIFAPNAPRFLGEGCGTGKCTGGTVTCHASNGTSICSSNALASLSDANCDGIDEDCNGITDDPFGVGGVVKFTDWDGSQRTKGQSCGTGICVGTVVCATNNSLGCSGALPGDDDTCDGIDQSCDGMTDEDYVAPATTCGVGSNCASAGEMACVDGNLEDTCEPDLGMAMASDATCDDFDDDCNGQTDEDFVESETNCGEGACSATGTMLCSAGVSGDTCSPLTPAASDPTCDGQDDDCDGSTDEDYTPLKCDTSPGGDGCATGMTACAGGSTSCVGDVACAGSTPLCSASGAEGVVDKCECDAGPPDSCPGMLHCVAKTCQ